MKIDATWFGFAWAGAFSVIWIVVSLFVMILPLDMMEMIGNSMGRNIPDMHMNMGFGFFFTGLIWWALLTGVTGWLIAIFYNKLI